MALQLLDLPFGRDALGPHISAETLDFHHGKHHRAYVEKTNELVAQSAGLAGASLVELIGAAKAQGNSKLFNNAAQQWNHNFFWQCLAPPAGQRPSGRLASLIDQCFGSAGALLEQLAAEAVNHFASGWAWLLLERGELRIASLHDADTPLVHDGMAPLLTLDLWEHAYYIDYRHQRPKYAAEVLGNIVNWEFVAANLDGQGAARADQPG